MVIHARGTRQLRKGRASEVSRIYHVTAVTLGRQPVFLDLLNARDVILSLRLQHELGSASMLCFVVMPDHLHWLFVLGGERQLDTVVAAVKTRSARLINARSCRYGSVWGRGYYDRAIRYDEDVLTVARYIVANPVRSGLVPSVGYYPHWDAVWVGARRCGQQLRPFD